MTRAVIVAVILFLGACTTGWTVYKAPQEYNKSVEVLFCTQNNCFQKLEDLFSNSQKTKCAFYALDNEDLIQIAKQRNAEIISHTNPDFIKSSNHNGLMHNKFCIFDDEIILTGSFNPTKNSNKSANNLIIINSGYLSKNYNNEFEEMKNGIYSGGKTVQYQIIIINNKTFENYFCPEDNCQSHVLEKINGAQNSIYFVAYSFTDDDVGDLLADKADQGISVKGFFDKSQLSQYSEYEKLKDFSKSIPRLHHKFFIIDNETVITGSYNPSRNGNENNDENILIIEDELVARKYLDEFERIENIA